MKIFSNPFEFRGFTSLVAQKYGYEYPQPIARVFRAIRADLSSSIMGGYPHALDLPTSKVLQRYFEQNSKTALACHLEANPEASLQDIYSFLKTAGGASIGLFLLYELDLFNEFYQAQFRRINPLTPFDALVLACDHAGSVVHPSFLDLLNRALPVKVDRNITMQHRNALALGQLTFLSLKKASQLTLE